VKNQFVRKKTATNTVISDFSRGKR